MATYKIGQQVILEKDTPVECMITNEKQVLRAGTRGYIDSKGRLRVNSRLIVCLQEDIQLKGYATREIARRLYQQLNSEFYLGELLEDEDIPKEEVIEVIEFTLASLLLPY